MPRKCRSQTLDVHLDFARPRSMTLSVEELKRIPSPKRYSDPTLEEKIHINIRDVGICRGLTRLRKIFGGEEESHQHGVKKHQDEFLEHSKQSSSYDLKSPISRIEGCELPCYFKRKHVLSGSELGFSPPISMNTIPSPSVGASLSTPEYANSPLEGSDDGLSDISSPVSSLIIDSRRDYRRDHRPASPSNLRRTVVKPHMFEFREESSDTNDDDGYVRRELQEQIEMAIEELKN